MPATIKILNPRDTPFGPLSNNAEYFMDLNGQRWSSATNYIYGMLLTNPDYRSRVQNAPPKNVQADYEIYAEREVEDTISKALDVALTERLGRDKEMMDVLRNTGDVPIYYISTNEVLGVGNDNQGKNLLGRFLMEIRHRAQIADLLKDDAQQSQLRDDTIVAAYSALIALQQAAYAGSDLSEFQGLDPQEIIKLYTSKPQDRDPNDTLGVGRWKALEIPPRKTVLSLYDQNRVSPAIDDLLGGRVDALVTSVRRQEFGDFNFRQQARRKRIVFNSFARSVLDTDFPEVANQNQAEAIRQQLMYAFGDTSGTQVTKLENDLFQMYEAGMFDPDLQYTIKIKLDNIRDIILADPTNTQTPTYDTYTGQTDLTTPLFSDSWTGREVTGMGFQDDSGYVPSENEAKWSNRQLNPPPGYTQQTIYPKSELVDPIVYWVHPDGTEFSQRERQDAWKRYEEDRRVNPPPGYTQRIVERKTPSRDSIIYWIHPDGTEFSKQGAWKRYEDDQSGNTSLSRAKPFPFDKYKSISETSRNTRGPKPKVYRSANPMNTTVSTPSDLEAEIAIQVKLLRGPLATAGEDVRQPVKKRIEKLQFELDELWTPQTTTLDEYKSQLAIAKNQLLEAKDDRASTNLQAKIEWLNSKVTALSLEKFKKQRAVTRNQLTKSTVPEQLPPLIERISELDKKIIALGGAGSGIVNSAPPINIDQSSAIKIYPLPDPTREKSVYDQFSPVYQVNNMFTIDSLTYPSVTHYVTARLLATIPSIKTIRKAYSLIVTGCSGKPECPEKPSDFKQASTIAMLYQTEKALSFSRTIKNNTKLALTKKFNSRGLQDLLLSTGAANLLWVDLSNPILGTGPKGTFGENYVGKVLMTLRTEITVKRDFEDIDRLTEADVSSVLMSSDARDLNAWFKGRIKDTCRLINLVRNYIFLKMEVDQPLTEKFVTTVLDRVYQPCSQLYGLSTKVTAPAPLAFRDVIRAFPGFQTAPLEVIDVLWRRAAVLIYFIIKNSAADTSQSVNKLLKQSVAFLSQKTECVRIIAGEEENCAVSAILNILRGIVEMNKDMGLNPVIEKVDVETAASIILNKDLSGDVEPTAPKDMMKVPAVAKILRQELRVFVVDPEATAELVLGAVEALMACPVKANVKRNRINFFATDRT
jgi:predicted NAD-dependent protein-ADP-ribosyltransferase YbiA (DUF1768 family)